MKGKEGGHLIRGGGVVYQESVAIGQKLKEQMSHKETVQAHGNRNN